MAVRAIAEAESVVWRRDELSWFSSPDMMNGANYGLAKPLAGSGLTNDDPVLIGGSHQMVTCKSFKFKPKK